MNDKQQLSLKRHEAIVLARSCLTFTDVPFTKIEKRPIGKSNEDFLDAFRRIVVESIQSDKKDRFVVNDFHSPSHIDLLTRVVEAVLAECGDDDRYLECLVGSRMDILSCLKTLERRGKP